MSYAAPGSRRNRTRIAPLPAVLLSLAVLFAACDDDDDDDNGIVTPGPDVIELELVAEGLTSPVALREAPDGTGRLFVADQAGQVRVITADGTLLEEPFLDLSDAIVELRTNFDERGLLGLAFHPQFASNGRFFVYYSAPLRAGAPADFDHTSHISEFRATGSANVANRSSERILLQVDEPQFNHNAGTLEFGPDGFLYISLGDGGGGHDVGVGHVADWYAANEGGNAQNVEANLLGKVLRIDVNSGSPYGIPGDNPFVGEPGRDEIYAWGFRNPYRFSFDMETGDLILADAGQHQWEEVNRVVRGGNYGWNVREGAHCFSTAEPREPSSGCPLVGQFGEALIDPVLEYPNASAGGPGIVVVGGVVYRGDDVPELDGRYIFGDYSRSFSVPNGIVYMATPGGSTWSFEELRFGLTDRGIGAYLLGFGQDLEGEVYILTTLRGAPSGSTGQVYRIVAR